MVISHLNRKNYYIAKALSNSLMTPPSFGIWYASTVGPRLSGHQLSGYLYYPAMILQYILSIFNYKVLLKKEKVVKYLFYFIVYPFYMNDNLLQIE